MKNDAGQFIYLRIDWFIEGMSIQDTNIIDSNSRQNIIGVHTSAKHGRRYSEQNLGDIKWQEFFKYLISLCDIPYDISNRNCKHISKIIFNYLCKSYNNLNLYFKIDDKVTCNN